MDVVIRAVAMYALLYVILRLSGKRNMAELSPFSFVLLLIVAESTQQALLGNDFSIATALIVIVTLVLTELVISALKQRFQSFETWLEGSALILVEDGKPIKKRLKATKIDEGDILSAARKSQGIMTMDQIRLAVLEKSGGISIIPRQ